MAATSFQDSGGNQLARVFHIRRGNYGRVFGFGLKADQASKFDVKAN
jgi:hypothetical protein